MRRSPSLDPISLLPREWRRRRLGGLALEAAARIGGWTLAFIAGAAAGDRFFLLPHAARWAIWLFVAGGLCAAFWTQGSHLRRELEWKKILGAAEARFPQLKNFLFPAWDLVAAQDDPGTSNALRLAHLEKTRLLLASISDEPLSRPMFSSRACRALVAGAVGAAFLFLARPGRSVWRVMEPWNDRPLEAFLNISPGDASLAWGKSALISVSWLGASPIARAPEDLGLRIKNGGIWRRSPWDQVMLSSAIFKAENLTAPLEYKISWRDEKSRSYRIVPVSVPIWRSLEINVRGPGQNETIPLDGAHELDFLSGSRITILGKPSTPLSRAGVIFSSGVRDVAMAREGELYRSSFLLKHDEDISFNLRSVNGRQDADPPHYFIKALADHPPNISLISPAAPVTASPGDVIPLSYSADDDGGLSKISIVIERAGSPATEIAIREFALDPKAYWGDYEWNIAELGLGRFDFFIKAYDNAQPPHTAATSAVILDIADWSGLRRHIALLLAKAQSGMEALRSREFDYSASLSKKSAVSQALAREGSDLTAAWARETESLSGLARAISKDPGADPGLPQSARQLADDANRFGRSRAQRAQTDLQSGNKNQSLSLHKNLADFADRASRLLKSWGRVNAGAKWQASAQKLMAAADALVDAAKRLDYGKGSKSGQSDIAAEIKKIEKQLENLATALNKIPPAAQGSNQAARTLPLAAAQQTARELKRALASGNINDAERLARTLSQELSQIAEGLNELASGAAGREDALAARRNAALRDQWSRAISDEAGVRDATRSLADGQTAAIEARQKKALEDIVSEQARIIADAQSASSFPQDVVRKMQSVGERLTSGRVGGLGSILSGIIGDLRLPFRSAPPSRAMAAVAKGEKNVLSRLRLAEGTTSPHSDKNSHAAAMEQERVRRETQSLSRGLADAASSGVLIPEEALRKVFKAQNEEARARDFLNLGNPAQALVHQEKALSLLSETKQDMSHGFSPPGLARGSKGESSSSSGARTGLVPLPAESDYLPPDLLRRQLQKSMEEKRPKNYEGIIREYFKRIAQ
ncbi:MAG: hypothetical protein ACYCPQ_01755 [Elusimicrobiota bacterium]